jgi:hypothetical protein
LENTIGWCVCQQRNFKSRASPAKNPTPTFLPLLSPCLMVYSTIGNLQEYGVPARVHAGSKEEGRCTCQPPFP